MQWRKSTQSGSTTNCVELRQDLAAVRDSKHPAAALPVPRNAVRRLIAQIHATDRD